MKKHLFGAAIAFAIAFGFSFASSANVVTDFIKNVKEKTLPVVCQKASVFSLKFSIRSAKGKACSNPLIGSFAVAVCPKFANDFEDSGCDKAAKKMLDGRDAKTVLKAEAKKLAGAARSYVEKAMEKAGIAQ